MSAGATTEGSIVGYLRLDASDWNETLDRAEARARELGRTDPRITVQASVGDALAKIESVRAAEASLGGKDVSISAGGSAAKIDAVAAAQKRLEAAERAAANAASGQYIAELRLEDVQGRRNKTALQVAVAEESVARATRNAEAAELRHVAATDALARAQQAAARAAMEEAAAQTVVAGATTAAAGAEQREAEAISESNASKGLAINRTGLLAAGIAALIPLLSPLAGYAAGVGGALLGMGAAGVLAVLGIKNEMERGTTTGASYSAGIQVIQQDLNQLEATASRGLLAGFERSITAIDDEMPSLNRNIGTLSTQLGTAGEFVTRGLVTGLRVLNPLFVQSAFYVEQLAVGFQKWTSDGGLQRFAQSAIASLPQVANALGSLLKGALDLVSGLAPLGSILLVVITILGQLLSLVAPLAGDLVPLGVAAAAVYGGFKLWQALSPIVDSGRTSVKGVGLDLSVMTGVAGLAVAAIGFIASAFVTSRMESSAAAAALQDYTAAVQQDNGVLGQNVKAQTAKALADKNSLGQYNSLGVSAIEIGKRLGLSAQTVTAAAEGQKTAIAAVNQVMTDYANNPANSTAKVAAFRANWNNLTAVIGDNQKKIKEAIKAYNDIASAQGQSTISTKAELDAQSALAASYGMSLPEMLAAQDAQKKNADQAAATTHELQLENDAATLLTNAFALLNGGTLNVAQAQTGAAAATNTLVDSLKQNGLEIDGNTKAAVANQQALQQKVQADQQAAEAIAKQTGSTVAGTQAFAASKQALIDQLTATGQLTPAIQALIDKYYAVPPVVKTKAELDADAAKKKADDLRAAIEAIRDRTITLTVQTKQSGAPSQMTANTSTGYKYAHAGEVGPAYLAAGGNPFVAQGTDTVPAMLTPHEFVVKEKSASYDPQFIKAYNDNPQKALDAVRGSGGQKVEVSLAGATITLDIDGQTVSGVIRKQVLGSFDDLTQELQGGYV